MSILGVHGIKIITDSTSDIDLRGLEELGVSMVRLKTVFEDGEYLDGEDLTAEEFYKKQASSANLPTTTQPTPADFENAYREALQEHGSVIAILISEKLSGTIQSALMAKQRIGQSGENIHIIDSGTTTIGLRVLVERAVELRDLGLTDLEMVEILEKEKDNIRLFAYVDTLEFLQKGGRLSKTAAIAGTLLDMKPIISVRDGVIEARGKVRGLKKAYSKLVEYADAEGIDFDKPVYMGYTGDRLGLEPFNNQVNERYDGRITKISTIGSVVGAHVGPGAAGLAFFSIK